MPEVQGDFVLDENGDSWEDRYHVCWNPISVHFKDEVVLYDFLIAKMLNSNEVKEAVKRLELIMDRGFVFGHYAILPGKTLLRLGCISNGKTWFEYLELND